jgi:hypothetical protein
VPVADNDCDGIECTRLGGRCYRPSGWLKSEGEQWTSHELSEPLTCCFMVNDQYACSASVDSSNELLLPRVVPAYSNTESTARMSLLSEPSYWLVIGLAILLLLLLLSNCLFGWHYCRLKVIILPFANPITCTGPAPLSRLLACDSRY